MFTRVLMKNAYDDGRHNCYINNYVWYDLSQMKKILLKSDDKLLEDTAEEVVAEKAAIEHYSKRPKRQSLEARITKEIKLLKKSDPDNVLKEEFEEASLYDLKEHLNE